MTYVNRVLWRKKILQITYNRKWILTQMYTQELEQEKYHLRRRLEVAEEEYELKVSELHSDITVSFCFWITP